MLVWSNSFWSSTKILLHLLLLTAHIAPAQHVGINPEKPINSLVLDRWTGEDGLISNNLTAVMQASDDFLWVTSFNGALRFDGHRFELFDKESLSLLNSNAFYEIVEEDNGTMWLATQGSGLITYKDGQFKKANGTQKLPKSIRSVFIDSKKRIWAGSNNEGVFVKTNDQFERLEHPLLEQVFINDIAEGIDGAILLATNQNGVIIFQNGQFNMINAASGLRSNVVNRLYKTNDGTMLIGTAAGLSAYTASGISDFKFFENQEINDILVDDYGTIWVGTEQGLGKLNIRLGISDFFYEKQGLPASQVSSICFDHENSLWISTKKAGLLRLKDGNFTNFDTNDGLSSNLANIVVEHNGRFYIGLDDGRINVIDQGTVRNFPIKTDYSYVGIRDILFDTRGTMWVAGYKGVLKIKEGRETVITVDDGLGANDVRAILEDSAGNMWFATRSAGLTKYDGKSYTVYDISRGLNSNYILSVQHLPNGDIMAGTHSGGLSVIKPDGNVLNYDFAQGNSGILIFNMAIESAEVQWVSTNVGIFRLEDGKFRKANFDKRFKTETFFDFVDDRRGNVWLTSNIGLFQVKKSDLGAYFNGKISEIPVKLYNDSDGMANKECTGATRSLLASDGTLWVPTLGGISTIDPSAIKINQKPPKVYITSLKTDFNNQNLSGDLSLDPDHLHYSFGFTGLSYLAPGKMQFNYKLEGFDKRWLTLGNIREAHYTNLPPGDYTFKVLASNNDGVWNDAAQSVHFTVNPHFYQTIWFYLILLACFALMVWAYITWRTHNVEKMNLELRKLNEELDRFVYSASHDLRAPLSSIKGLVEISRFDKTVEAKNQYLEMIGQSVLKLDSFIKDIIDYSRNQRIEIRREEINFKELIEEVYQELKYLDKENTFSKTYDIAPNLTFYSDRRRLSVVLNNLVSNSIRYYDPAKQDRFIKITVRQAKKSGTIELLVEDNGRGIKPEHVDRIFEMFYRAQEGGQGSGLGLFIVKETIEKLNGTIAVESAFLAGTKFTITIPTLS